MSLSEALHAAAAVLRRRPADLLPFYLLGAAVPAVARVFAFLGLGVAWAYLEVTGRLDAVLAGLAGRDLNPPDPEQAEAFAEWAAEVGTLLAPLATPAAVAAVAAGLLAALVAAIVLAAAVSAGQVATCDARLAGARGLTAGVAGVRRHWRAFLAAYAVEGLVWTVVSVGLLAAVGLAAAVSNALALVLAPPALLVWLAVVVPVRALFAFVPAAIVVDDAGFPAAVRSAAGFLRREPAGALGYYALSLGALLAFGTVLGLLALVEVQAAAAPLGFLVLAPALDLVKTGLYGAHRGELSPAAEPVPGLRRHLGAGLRRGLREVGRFVRETPGLHALAAAVGVAGVAAGWVAVAPLVGVVDTSIVERLADHVPPLAAANFFGNNWTVAASTAFSGVALGVPAALAVWFNGVVFGAVARLEVAPRVLVAFVLPHGLLELPSLVVAGALGGHLGRLTWRTWRGRAARAALADGLERVFRVVVGLGVLLAAAGLIEGFVSPYYWRPFLGG